MSSILANPSRLRLPRGARNAVERARLSVVPVRRTKAPRMPFAVLVFLLLGAGVVGLLMFNTHMQQLSFHATALQAKSDELVAREQALDMELDRLRDPQRLAHEGRRLGMVAPAIPAFIRLADGAVIGQPTAALADDFIEITPPPPVKPAALDPDPVVIKVQPQPKPTVSGPVSGTTGSGTAGTGPAAGSNGTAPATGATSPTQTQPR